MPLLMKYVMFEGEYGPTPILFPPTLKHDEMVRIIGSALGKPASAGFVSYDLPMSKERVIDTSARPRCHGESTSLGLRSRKEDAESIQRWMEEDYSYNQDHIRNAPKALNQGS